MNIRKLKPIELMRLVNSNAERTVLSEKRLRRDREKCAYLVGDGTNIDLLRYVAWLMTSPSAARRPQAESAEDAYEANKKNARDRAAENVRAAQDIGELPEVKNPERRGKAFLSFKYFCEAYFPQVFTLQWSQIHLNVIEKLERVICNGENFALAMPRGSGKTTLNELAIIWAGLTGKASFCALIASSSDRAQNLLNDIKIWLETNEELFADFPEVCLPIRKLERIANRQKGQRYQGVPTRIEWGAKSIVFPTIEGSQASGCVIQCAGMNGAEVRGLGRVDADGCKVRPNLVLVDDPQTRESAKSSGQCDERERIIKADILGMAGPGMPFACCITMTVIATNDVAERLLDRSRNPDFRGERYMLLPSPPKNLELWEEYNNIREAELQNDGDGAQATEYYRQHQAEMDEGAVTTWPERFNPKYEISGIQYAMNLKFRDEDAFQSEYQNQPIVTEEGDDMLSAADIQTKTNGVNRGIAPAESQILTAFIDVHKDLLYWVAIAWERNFTGFVVDYGTFPEQKRRVFQMSEARPIMSDVFQNTGVEATVFAGLKALTESLAANGFTREDGLRMTFDKILIDSGWNTDVVHQFCRSSGLGGVVMPARGNYVGAASRPFSDYKRQKGDWIGPHWRVGNNIGKRLSRFVLVDTNYWKSFVHARLSTKQGESGCLTLNGDPSEHALVASHLTAEYRVVTEANLRRVDEWRMRMRRADNHWFDCFVGATVAASMCGATLPTFKASDGKPACQRVTYEEMMRRKR